MKRIFFRLLLAAISVCAASPAFGADGGSPSAQELDRIKQEMTVKKKDLKRATRRERSVLADLEKINRKIQAGIDDLAGQEENLRRAEETLNDIESASAGINRELESLKHTYGLRLRALYKMRRSGRANLNGSIRFSDSIIKQVKYLGLIAIRDREIMNDYDYALTQLRQQQREVEEKKNRILESRRSIERKKAELESIKRKKSTILASIRQQKGLYEQTLQELEEASVNLWGMIKEDEQGRSAEGSGGRDENMAISGKRFPWPLEGKVVSQFGKHRHPRFGTMVFRHGIEIKARSGQKVKAVEDGQVAYADWYRGYGKLVILEHDHGFYTLYGNLQKLDLKKGDRVTKGQPLGSAGETGSMEGAKLYFEIRRNGEAQDPLSWLAHK